MLKRLLINNFVLIDHCEIKFEEGLNIITGETGAGKTAILESIALILGMRADASLIRKGEAKATIEASFEVSKDKDLSALLSEAGVPFDPNEWLTIRRELVLEGKNRAFINGSGAPLPLLQKVGTLLIDLFSQHSHQTLRQTSYHRHLLDLFGGLKEELATFQQALKEEKALCAKIDKLQASQNEREKEVSYNTYVVQEIDSADLKEDEDDKLFAEYSRLSNSSELTENLSSVVLEITESQDALLSRLNFWINRFSPLTSNDKSLESPLSLLTDASVSLSEAARDFSSLLSDIDNDPLRKELLEQRLELIDKLKKKYGKTFEGIEKSREEAQKTLDHYLTLDETLAQHLETQHELEHKTNTLATSLTQKRKAAASHLAPLVTEILHSLNMEGSAFTVGFIQIERNSFGDEEISFFLKANSGENAAPVSSRSSGGELARLMLAITTLLAEKNQTETLLFDEIDANIGGETATKIGKTLSYLGTSRQVICITHFPQVAKHAHAHFRVQKQETNNRTLATIDKLNSQDQKQELTRMLGGSPL